MSLLQIEDGIFEVKGTHGDTHLGGEDFDNNMVDFVLAAIKRTHGKDLKADLRASKRVRTACERAKRTLSTQDKVTIVAEGVLDGEDAEVTVSRAKFEQLNIEPFERCLETVKRVMVEARADPADVMDVVLVGGSTRIPKVQEMLREFFGGKELCKSINPDEAVAYGAAVQGAILSGKRHSATESLLLVDVVPLSLGIELTGQIFSAIIKRNTAIPSSASKTYTTEEDF